MSWHPPETDVHRPRETHPVRKRAGGEPEAGSRRIMHVDMDAFFAAVEQRDQPQLRGKPVIVGGLPGSRGVVSTCSYEAREYGVRSGMALTEAQRRCPHGIFLKTHGSKYIHASVEIVGIFHSYSPVVEPVSIDEAYLDITGSIRMFGSEEALGRAMKREIFQKLHLTCSVGIAPTRAYAKLASGMNKPDGLTIVTPESAESVVYPLPVEKLWGIGDRSMKVLHELGIHTIGELAQCPVHILTKRFGINGKGLKKTAAGKSGSEVTAADEQPDEKSIGNEHTFHMDVGDMDAVHRMLLYLSQKVGARVRRKGFAGRTVTLKIRYSDFETHTHRETFHGLYWDDMEIYRAGRMLLEQVYEKGRKIRLIGVSISGLVRIQSNAESPEHQVDLFEEGKVERNYLPAFDSIREKYGKGIITRAAAKR